MTREEWLQAAVSALRPRFKNAGFELPALVHVSVGFPSRRALASKRGAVIGQCWSGAHSADKAPHIFISPLLGSGVDALDTLAHELVHAVMPAGTGHKAPFVRACKALGLTAGPPKSQGAGPELREELERLNAQSPYPHASLDARAIEKPQTTRLAKVQCLDCGYVARVTRVWLDGPGAPVCPTDNIPMEEV